MAKEAGISTELFKEKTKEFRKKHDDTMSSLLMIPSDENDDEDEDVSKKE